MKQKSPICEIKQETVNDHTKHKSRRNGGFLTIDSKGKKNQRHWSSFPETKGKRADVWGPREMGWGLGMEVRKQGRWVHTGAHDLLVELPHLVNKQ